MLFSQGKVPICIWGSVGWGSVFGLLCLGRISLRNKALTGK